MRPHAVRRAACSTLVVAIATAAMLAMCAAGAARAQLRQADPTLRDAQLELRSAARDTAGHASDPARLDSLGVAHLRLAHATEARAVFERVLALDAGDAAANAGLGRLALVQGRLAEAESLLTRALARDRDPDTVHDLFVACLQQGDYARAASLAEEAGEPGRVEVLRRAVESPPYAITDGLDEVRIPFTLTYPVACVRVKLNGVSVLLAIDSGARDLLLDTHTASSVRALVSTTQSSTDWMGRHIAVTEAVVQKLEIGGLRMSDVPAGLLRLHSYGIQLNPRSEPVVGTLGIGFLRAFTPTIDYLRQELVLRRPGVPWTANRGALRVPFEVWGEHALMVPGNINGGRRTMLQVHTGIPECGFAAPNEVFAEAGLKAGTVSRMMKGAGSWLPGARWARVGVPGVTAGDVSAGQMPGWAFENGVDALWRYGMRSDGFLSHDFFRGWRVTFDWTGRALVFEHKD